MGTKEQETPTTITTTTDYTLERWIAVLLALLFLIPFIANGQELPTTTLGETEDAALLLKTGTDGVYVVVPAVSSDVTIRVAGPVVRTHVRQVFRNVTGRCSEGLYVFPLPEMSAVDSLKMTIGTRLIVGEIKEKEEAVRQYQQARSEGRRAALVEQHRPNIFTTSVASILPDEEATIEIEYQETARYEDGEYGLRFPMVVAPRYKANANYVRASLGGAPVSSPAPFVNLNVELQPGYSLRNIRSEHHRIRQETLGQGSYRVALDQQQPAADRDFELAWQPDLGSTPEATVLTEKTGSEHYALVMVTPPAVTPVRIPRDTVFIIDSSGSMEGQSMEQAREALLLALDDLRPSDTFNIIDFDSEARSLFPQSQPVDQQTIEHAKEFVTSLQADGGTEMLKAIRLALPGDVIPGTVRQVIFMTDGQVGSEQQLFSYIHSNLGDSRLFTVGIGSAPNSHFMRNAARFGRGTFTHIGDLKQVRERMAEMFGKLGSPVMTGVQVAVSDHSAEVWPQRVPDVYRGEPLVIAVRVSDPRATISIRGKLGDQLWSRELTLTDSAGERGIGKLWARQKIESTLDRLSEGAEPALIRGEVVAVALRHHLVSPYTSLVAIDRTPEGVVLTSCKTIESSETNVSGRGGELPQTATASRLLTLVGLALILLSIAAMKFVW